MGGCGTGAEGVRSGPQVSSQGPYFPSSNSKSTIFPSWESILESKFAPYHVPEIKTLHDFPVLDLVNCSTLPRIFPPLIGKTEFRSQRVCVLTVGRAESNPVKQIKQFGLALFFQFLLHPVIRFASGVTHDGSLKTSSFPFHL